MEKITVSCPVCGKENEDLFLDETDGWVECIACGHIFRLVRAYGHWKFMPPVRCS